MIEIDKRILVAGPSILKLVMLEELQSLIKIMKLNLVSSQRGEVYLLCRMKRVLENNLLPFLVLRKDSMPNLTLLVDNRKMLTVIRAWFHLEVRAAVEDPVNKINFCSTSRSR